MMKRQGDLLIVKIDKIPEDAVKHNSRILAEGETTGHVHELDSGEVYEKAKVLYFRVTQGKNAMLKHPEHGVVTFESGEYKVIRQREYEPRGWRYVRD